MIEIEKAIETLPAAEIDQLAVWIAHRHAQRRSWPVPPPQVERKELDRIEAEIEAEFPTLSR